MNKNNDKLTTRIARFFADTWTDLAAGIKTNRFKRGGTATLITVLVIVFAVLLNVVAAALTERFVALSPDLTKGRVYSLSDVTVELLDGLDTRVEIDILASEAACLYPAETTDPYGHIPIATELIRRYAKYTDNVRVQFIDLNADPWFLDLIPDYRDAIRDYSIVVRSALRTRVTSFYEMLPSLSNTAYTDSSSVDLESSLTECVISSLIKTVTMDVNPTVAYIDMLGGGEDVDYLLNALEINGYTIIDSRTFSFGFEPIPEETEMVIIAAPEYDITASALNQLSDFLENGGSYGKTVMILTSSLMAEMPNLATLTEEWGIGLTRNLVCEGSAEKVIPTQSADTFYATYYSAEYIDDDIISERTPLYRAVELDIPHSTLGSIAVNTVLSTSKYGYVVRPDGSSDPSDTDFRSVMAQATYYGETTDGAQLRSDLIVAPVSLCDDTFFNLNASSRPFSNFDLMMRICNERCGIADQTLNISAVSINATDFAADMNTVTWLTVLFGYVVPLGLLLTGLIIYLRRRRL